jgi:hypothetical protein
MYKPGNQTLLTIATTPGTDYFIRKSNINYLMYTTAAGFGIGGAIGGNNRIFVNTAQTASRQGFRMDISDTKDIVSVGDKVRLQVSGESGTNVFPTVQEYEVVEVITPEIEKKSGQYVSFRQINLDTIPVKNPESNRTYQFDISINISDIST